VFRHLTANAEDSSGNKVLPLFSATPRHTCHLVNSLCIPSRWINVKECFEEGGAFLCLFIEPLPPLLLAGIDFGDDASLPERK
jgi:hypothetical protein